MSSIEKSNVYNLEGQKKQTTSSSGIERLYKINSETRKMLLQQDEEDRQKIQEGKYEGDVFKWKPRINNITGQPNQNYNTHEFPPPQKRFSPHTPEELPMPQEIFAENEEIIEIQKEKVNLPPQQRFDNLVKTFYNSNSYMTTSHKKLNELEVRFGTKGIKPITKSDYDNVVKKLKSFGFKVRGEESGEYYLRINCEFLDSTTGKFKLSNIRTEIKGLTNVQEYCRTNDIKGLPIKEQVEFITKKPTIINDMRVSTVDFDDFNFRVALNTEEQIDKMGLKNYILDNWKKSKKEFRFINRVTFKNDEYPFVVDLSIVKFGNRSPDKFGNENRGPIIRVYTFEESNVLNNQEIYEIEIELVNSEIGPGTKFNNPGAILESLRKLIKYVLGGLQGTNFPISYLEQKSVMETYMKMIIFILLKNMILLVLMK